MEVRDNQAESRFELEQDGAVAVAAYDLDGEVISFTHTVVPVEIEGQGIGSALIGGALEAARARGLKVIPICGFVRAYIDRHPETQDLLA
jgi:hypothetical protein